MKAWLAVGALAAVLAVSGCGGNGDKAKCGNAAKSGVPSIVRVGAETTFPPFEFTKDDKYVGFDLDLAAEVCKRNDWELVKQSIDWDAKDMELNSGTISCIWNGFTMNGREDEYAWTEPYVDNSQVFVVKADSGIATFADLAGKSVAVQTDSSAEAALKEDDNK